MTEKIKRHFKELKEKHPDRLYLFRVGDFYESFQEDAEVTARVLGITLTKDKEGIKQAMFPLYELDAYLPKLIKEGHRIGICDEN